MRIEKEETTMKIDIISIPLGLCVYYLVHSYIIWDLSWILHLDNQDGLYRTGVLITAALVCLLSHATCSLINLNLESSKR